MRVFRSFLLPLTLVSFAFAQNLESADVPKQKHDYQSDVARLRKIVINSLYSHRDVFLRELLSNANDALEKLRLTALTEKQIWDGEESLNITIKAIKDEDGKGGRVVISDTGIGMSADELAANLGTLAKSGTTEFLQKAESSLDGTGSGNLIGAFGLGFYSSFLVADRVYVASISPKSEKNPEPKQHVFSSSAEESTFEVYPDPRGNTLGTHGTEITLILKDDAEEFLDQHTLQLLVNKHSAFSSNFPIYLWATSTKEVPEDEESAEESVITDSEEEDLDFGEDDDQVILEDVTKKEEKKEDKEIKMKEIEVQEWMHLNPMPPVWVRDPKNVSDYEYTFFYHATFKDFTEPLAWYHFSGDAGTGTSFKAIVYIPGRLDQAFWQEPLTHTKDIRLMVKRVFITNDLGNEDPIPKWASWVKVVVDADDLPLNVSRETLQQNKFLKQIKKIIVKRLIQLLQRLAEEDPSKFDKIQEIYGSVIKLGAIEDASNREKLTALSRFSTNQRNNTSLNEYVENKKQGQKQIFYLADVGKPVEVLKKSVFVEKLHARGYEVILANEPLDEVLFQNLRKWQKLPFQDVAKAGLKFGDEEIDAEEEKATQQELSERYKPLLAWLKDQTANVVRDVVISNRLVTSPCAIVADKMGFTANVERLLNAAQRKQEQKDIMHEVAKKQKVLEINPNSPLIQGLLKRVQALPTDEDERDLEVDTELKEVASILIDGALVRSGFEVPDTNEFFSRVDRVLRRSLGVSEDAKTEAFIKPAPPVDPELPTEEVEENEMWFDMEEVRKREEQKKNKGKMFIGREELDRYLELEKQKEAAGEQAVHDEL